MTFTKIFLAFFIVFCYSMSMGQTTPFENSIDTGYATFYAKRFEGRKTSSGEVFSHIKYTCAHKTLPFGTRLQVTRLDNQKTVTVVVNDRGPHVKNNMIDLSRIAAEELGMIREGRILVKIEVLE